MKLFPNNSKIVRDLQNSLFIHKIFADLKNDHAFQKMFVKSIKFYEFEKLFRQFPKQCSRIQGSC